MEIDAHVSNVGWQGWDTPSASMGGTTGKSQCIEAMQIRLTGELAQNYDVYYRVHAANIGWMGWAKDGDSAGTQGYSRQLEAVQVKLVKKGEPAPGSTSDAFRKKPMSVATTAHVSNLGWLSAVEDGATAGTTGRSLALEALKVEVRNSELSGSVEINAHVSNVGWQGWSSTMGGTTGQSRRIEAVQIRLTDELAQNYDVWYRVHAANIGWMGWAKDGDSAGTQGYSYQVEAVQVKLVKKGGTAPGSTSDAFRKKPMSIDSTAHVSNLGWLSTVEDGATAGTTGRGLALEALKVEVRNSDLSGAAEVNAHVSDIGWQGWGAPNTYTGGTTGQSRRIEAVQIRLTGELAQNYDVWYRVHAAGYGWMGWAKDGASAGTEGCSCQVEAVQVKLVKKDGSAPGSTDRPFIAAPSISYSSLVRGSWQGSVSTGSVSGTTGQSTAINAMQMKLSSNFGGGISYSVHLSNLGWQSGVSGSSQTGSLNGSQSVQAIKISLYGEVARYFDVYYRVHIDNFGWLGWACNGASAGTTSCSLNVQAYEVRLVYKGGSAPGGGTAYYSSTSSLPYIGYQNASRYYQVSNRSVSIKNQGSGIFGYRTESRISYNATRSQLIETMISRAYDYMGTAYKWDYSCAPGVGVDCAGLVMQALYAVGMDLSPFNPWDHYYTPGHDHYANDMWNSGRFAHYAFSQRQRGDLVCYPGHIAIYVGNDRIIEAYPGVVRTSSVYSSKNIKGVLRPIN